MRTPIKNKHQKDFLYYLELWYRNFGGVFSINDFPRNVRANVSKIEPLLGDMQEKGIIKRIEEGHIEEGAKFQIFKLPSEFYDC
ncbi:hypothetical protein ATI61_116163 [Archangium gephyra]|uniref:Uncharacterized protein n=1 Tax=Archangium gephyra TaxID=48 RepID=A0AAC8TGU4_9BACT|nr:hypothetical protein [Archangium gephyra]AKJ03916.1 Hypothetical protein AA314_05542 [Archangium gephyra]REG23691.1 hypothetical protein ATI61_116163 [Archangium gephyra]